MSRFSKPKHFAHKLSSEMKAFQHKDTKDVLTTKERNALPKSDFAEPEKRKYPIENKSHARNALARVSEYGSPKEKNEVRSAVKKKYPSIGQKASSASHKEEEDTLRKREAMPNY